MDPDLLSYGAGVALSLFFSYAPKAKPWFDGLDGTQKRGVMLLLIVLVAVAAFLSTCFDWYVVPGMVCTKEEGVSLVGMVIKAAIANQTTYQLTPKS